MYGKRQSAHNPCFVALTTLFTAIKRLKNETNEDATTSDNDAPTPDGTASTLTRKPPYVPARNCRHIKAALKYHHIAFNARSMPSTLSLSTFSGDFTRHIDIHRYYVRELHSRQNGGAFSERSPVPCMTGEAFAAVPRCTVSGTWTPDI